MKKNLTYFLIIFISFLTFSQAQTKSILDKKNGFKDIKIGDNYSKWSDKINYTNSNNGIKYYDFEGDCCRKLFSKKLKKVRLGFKNNILDVIYLETPIEKNYSEGWTSSEYKYLKGSFEEVLEERGTEVAPNDNSGNIRCLWLGKNIQMILTYEYMGLKNFDERFIKTDRCNILISKKPDLKSGF